MYHKGSDEKFRENKNTECYFEQILGVAPHKTAVVRPFASNLTNHPSIKNKTG